MVSQTVVPRVQTRPLSQAVVTQLPAEERPFQRSAPESTAAGATSQSRMPVVTPTAAVATSQSRMPVVTPTAAVATSQSRMPVVTPMAAESPRPQEIAQAQPKPAQQPAPAQTPGAAADATQEALREAAARAARRRYTPPAQRAAPAQAKAAAAATPAADPTVRAEYAKAHLNELMQRRRQALHQPAAASSKPDPRRVLRQAQELLRDQHYARAEELLRELLEQEAADELIRTYYLWAKYRVQPELDGSHMNALLELAKKLLPDPEHGGFASYVLGHLYMADKKDELAEKYFRRAHSANKNNKDAERHLLILERRKQLAAEAESTGNRKIFGITIASKPKSS
jgi:tetratricopeptide (TPR) repeat protein